MTIYLFSGVYLFYSRIIFKKLDDSARILFRKVEKTFKNKTISVKKLVRPWITYKGVFRLGLFCDFLATL